MKTSIIGGLVAALIVVPACKSKGDEPAREGGTTETTAPKVVASPTPTATPVVTAKADAPGWKHAWHDEPGRGGAGCTFVKWGESYDHKRQPVFKLTLPPGKIDSVQTWEFYYDKAGKHLGRYPHATGADNLTVPLGESGTSIPKDTDTVECEISRITFDDKTHWFNGNLVRNFPDRPKGGIPDAELVASTGEMVVVEILDAKLGKVKLTNVSKRDIKEVGEVDVIYFHKDGSHDAQMASDVEIALKAGASLETTLKLSDPPPADIASIDATVPEVTFADDTKWHNGNLSGYDLP